MQNVTVENGVVTATGSGSIEAPDCVQCGDTYSNGVFTMSETRRITAIKTACGDHILAALPMWKQVNYTARFAELLSIAEADRTINEAAEIVALKAIWAKVKAARAHSNQLETDPTKTANDAQWPAIL
jgi:hypothetical protein